MRNCEKCAQELENGNTSQAKYTINSIEKDLLLLSPNHKSFARLVSLVLNMKAEYYSKV
jgi:hypothetical protein